MPDITLPTFTNGVAAPSATFNGNLYTVHATAPASLEVINGWLDEDNLPSGRQITKEHIQPGAFAVAGEVASNAPLDFFDDLFDTTLVANGHSTADTEEDFIPIPGGCVTFYQPYASSDDCLVLCTWNIAWLSDGDAAGEVGVIRVGYSTEGTPGVNWTDALRRVCVQTVADENSGGAAELIFRGGLQQHWAGHALLVLPRGWHTVGLYVASTALQTRVYDRAMRYLVIRRT